MWWLFIIFIITAVASYLLAPKPNISPNPGMQGFASPTADCNRVVPEVFGTVNINGNCIYYGGYWSNAIKQKSGGGKGKGGGDQTIGYAYFATFAYGISTPIDAILEIRRNSQLIYPHVAWDSNGNEIYTAGNWVPITANGQGATIQTGVTSRAGGSNTGPSNVFFYMGSQTAADPHGIGASVGGQAFYDTAYASFPNVFIGDNVASVPNYSFTVKRTNILGTVGGYNFASVQVLNQGASIASQLVGNANQIAIMQACIAQYADVNPVNVILYMLMNFLFIPIGNIDVTSFWNAANTVFSEDVGVSFQMDKADDAKKWITEMLQVVDGVLYFNTRTAMYTIKLLRGGYSTSGLPVISDNNCESVQFARKSAENLPYAINLTYTEKFSFQGTSATIYNNTLDMMSTTIKQQQFNFPSVAADATANVVLSRLVFKNTFPYASMTVVVSRVAFETLNVGDVFLFTNSKLGVANMCCRVMNISSENQYDQKITVEAIEDIYNVNNTTYTPIHTRDVMPIPIPTNPAPINNVLVWDAYQEMSNTPAVFVCYAPATGADNVKVYINNNWVNDGGANDFGYGVLSSIFTATSVIRNENEIDNTNTITITAASAAGLTPVSATNAQLQRLTYTAIIYDTNQQVEIISFQTCVQNGDNSWTLSSLVRGLMNTTIQSHGAGSQIWIYWNNGNNLPTYPVVAGITNTIALIPTNVAGPGNTYTTTYTSQNIELTPYPISNLTGNNSSGVTTLSWETAVRLGGANYRDPDTFAAGEVASEGNIQITCSQGTFTVPAASGVQSWSINATASDTYTLVTVLNGYMSSAKTITV